MSLTPQGYVAKRADDYISDIQEEYERLTNLSFDWSREDVLRNLTVIFGRRLGALDELTQAIYDSRDRNNAQGIQMDTLLQLAGGQRQIATFSRVPGTITGDPGTNIPANRRVQGGGTDGRAQWRLLEDTTIPASGSIIATFEALEAGATTASPGEITTILTPVSGWDAITNSTSATPGLDREEDDDVLERLLEEDARVGDLSPAFTREVIKDTVSAVKGVVVLTNLELVPQTIAGKTIPERSINVVVHPSTLTATEIEQVMEAIYLSSPPVKRYGTDVTGTVTAEDDAPVPIAFDWADELTVDIVITLTLKSKYVLADVETTLDASVVAHLADLNVGDSLTLLDLNCIIAQIEGIKSATITLNGTAADLDPSIVQIITLSDLTIVEA